MGEFNPGFVGNGRNGLNGREAVFRVPGVGPEAVGQEVAVSSGIEECIGAVAQCLAVALDDRVGRRRADDRDDPGTVRVSYWFRVLGSYVLVIVLDFRFPISSKSYPNPQPGMGWLAESYFTPDVTCPRASYR
jgi:hypothetical protein